MITDTAAFRNGLDQHLQPRDPDPLPDCDTCGHESVDHIDELDRCTIYGCRCMRYAEPQPCPDCSRTECDCDRQVDLYRERDW